MINDIINRALVRAKIASVKETFGIYRTDSLTLVPWQVGKNLLLY